MTDADEERLIDLLSRCYDDPDLFNTAILGRAPYWSAQRQWCRDIVEYRSLAIETGNAVGKDYWVGGIVPWWLWTRPNSLVIVTGPGQSVLGSVTWKEIRRALSGSPFAMGGKVSTGIKTSPHTVNLGEGWQALGYSTTSIERMSGQHAGNLFVLVEEASGVEREVWDAIDGLKAKKLAAIANPIRPDGGFVDLCDQGDSDAKHGVPKREATCHRVLPSTASPHADLDDSPVGLADRTWLAAMAAKYGVHSLWYRVHVLAERPKQSSERILAPEDLDRCWSPAAEPAAAKRRQDGRAGRPKLGCDVGEGCGNAMTVIPVRDDAGVLELYASGYAGPAGAAEQMGRLAAKWGVREADVSYDGAGQTGKRLGNALANRGFRRAVPYFGSGSGGKRCENLRTACALAFARRLDPEHDGGRSFEPFHIPMGPHVEPLREELLELKYRLVGDKSALENKEDLMDRLGRSPDYADALTQTFREEAIAG